MLFRSGCGSTYSNVALNNALDLFNNNYDKGELFTTNGNNRCFLSCPLDGSAGSLRIASQGKLIDDVNELSVYPNPARENITINFNSKSSGLIKIDLLNMNGDLVRNLIDRVVYEDERVEQTTNISDIAQIGRAHV